MPGERAREAQAKLEAFLAVREKAARLRMAAQGAFGQGEAVQQEARRVRDAARRALDSLVVARPRDFASRAAAVREIDDAEKTRFRLQRAVQGEAWDEADRARIRASVELLKVLNAVGTAKAWAERELDEGESLLAMAESFKESAQRELSNAQAMVKGLLVDGQQAYGLLEITTHLPQPAHQERATVSQAHERRFVPLQEEASSGPGSSSTPGPGEAGVGVGAGKVENIPEEINEEALKEELAALRRSLESILPPRNAIQTPDVSNSPLSEPSQRKEIPPDLALLLPQQPPSFGVSIMPAPPPLDQQQMPQLIDWEGLAAQPGAWEAAPAEPLPATCSGRLSLVFTPCPDTETLGILWEALDRIAGVGGVVDARPHDEEAGFEFVLDLGNQILVVEELRGLIPHTRMVALGKDRLNIICSS